MCFGGKKSSPPPAPVVQQPPAAPVNPTSEPADNSDAARQRVTASNMISQTSPESQSLGASLGTSAPTV